ncbi:MAG: glycosyltransferase family 4 protein [Deltaproteobacteria bacterium]|nr:glycosyltransferase family 4 protein [Deltaproteobacteria bacterium]
MHIVFISHYFPPEVNAPANRTYEHARRWVADGHQVTVITGVPNHPKGEIFPGYENKWIQEENRDGIRVIRTWMYLGSNENVITRSLNYILFAFTVVYASFLAKDPDVVVATTPQFFSGVAGVLVSRLKRRPFVLEVRDLWPDSIVQLLQLRRGILVRFLELIEKALYKSTSGIVVNSRAFIDHIATFGIPNDRMALIYNGIDPSLFQTRERDVELLRENGLDGKFIVAYVGTLGIAHGLVTVLDAAQQLRDLDDVVFVLIGDGADRVRLEEEIAERDLRNVRLLGLRPRSEIPRWLASIDVSLVLLRDIPVLETVVPSKIFETLAEARPVLVAGRGEVRRLIEEAKAGFVIDPEVPDQIARAVRYIRAHPDEAKTRALAGREWVAANFQRDDLARAMAKFLEEVARRAR